MPMIHRRLLDPALGRYCSKIVHLEMRQAPTTPAPQPPFRDVELSHWPRPGALDYLALFRRVGEPWLWYERLAQTPEQIETRLHACATAIYRLDVDGQAVGFVELDHSVPGEVEIAYFGVVADWHGRGLGGYLLRSALHKAWQGETRRVWLHTCSEDHSDAFDVYRHYGFRPFREEIEWVHDPRLRGLLPRHAAPHVPIPE